jgi:hypothetical protein
MNNNAPFCAFYAFLWLKNPCNLLSTKDYVRKNKPICTNKPNFRKSQMNINKVLTKNYGNWTLGHAGKTNPIQTQYKANSNPIKAKTNPIQSQTNPISNVVMLFGILRLLLLPISVMLFAGMIWPFVRPDFQLREINM